MNIIVTGGAGFIGGNFMHYMVNRYPEDTIICVDALTYAGNLSTLEMIKNKSNYRFHHADITDRVTMRNIFEQYHPDIVVNFAAESHVDRSITEPDIFIKTNVLGTQVLLDLCKEFETKRFHMGIYHWINQNYSLQKKRLFIHQVLTLPRKQVQIY